MRQKLQFIAQALLLIFLSAFVLRPVVVTVNTGLSLSDGHSTHKSLCDSHPDLVDAQVHLRPMMREKMQNLVLTPCFTKEVLASSDSRTEQFASDPVRSIPRDFLILRI